jgi:hypothetical protein
MARVIEERQTLVIKVMLSCGNITTQQKQTGLPSACRIYANDISATQHSEDIVTMSLANLTRSGLMHNSMADSIHEFLSDLLWREGKNPRLINQAETPRRSKHQFD